MKKRIYFILILSSCLIASLTASRTQAQAASLFADVPEGYWASLLSKLTDDQSSGY
jgi:hypothetical protein